MGGGGVGTVEKNSTDNQYRCRIPMQKEIGLRLQTDSVVVASEDACYDQCVKRADGCTAFSYSKTDRGCRTAG